MKSLIHFALAISLIIASISCDSEVTSKKEFRYKKLPKIKTTFKKIVTSGWNKNLYEIQSAFPGGDFYDGNKNRKIAKQYRMNAELTDINANGRLSFSQLGDETLSDPTGQIIRNFLVEIQPEETLENKYQNICKFIVTNFKNVAEVRYNDTGKVEHHIHDNEYCLINFDDKGDVHIGIDLDRTENTFHISITHSIVVKNNF